MTNDVTAARAAVAEFTATAFLLTAVVGSGIMGELLAGGNVAVALLANSLATGAALLCLILAFGPISGAHMNRAVTLADASQGGLAWRRVSAYLVAQHRPFRRAAAAPHRRPRRDAQMLVTMGCGNECPVVPGVVRDDWPPKVQNVRGGSWAVSRRGRIFSSSQAMSGHGGDTGQPSREAACDLLG
jgi:hypothetical protein